MSAVDRFIALEDAAIRAERLGDLLRAAGAYRAAAGIKGISPGRRERCLAAALECERAQLEEIIATVAREKAR